MSFQHIFTYLKDFSAILFALTGTVVAILTYRRARETLLQPVRSEVIKKQTDLLINLLNVIGQDVSNKADYMGIINVNILQSMLNCGARFKDEARVKKLLQEEVGGGVFGKEGAKLVEVVPVFEKKKKEKEEDPGRKFYKSAKAGKYKIPIIQLTKKHMQFSDELDEFINNPFVPTDIKQLLEKLDKDIRNNITKYLTESVENSINDSFSRGGTDIPSLSGVYNSFHRPATSHDRTVKDLRQSIRTYLKIDSMP
jgi:hypothetical protein